jgi:PmbA protein
VPSSSVSESTPSVFPAKPCRASPPRFSTWPAAGGATAAEAEVSEGFGLSVGVRHGEVETIEHNRDKGIGVTVYLGQRAATPSTSDFSADALARTVDKALAIARFTAEDDCAGPGRPDLLAKDIPTWTCFSLGRGRRRAPWTWRAPARRRPWRWIPRISNSEGASLSSQVSHFIYANSLGFSGGYPGSRQSLSCAVIAEEHGAMQRDYWYTTARSGGPIWTARKASAGAPASVRCAA